MVELAQRLAGGHQPSAFTAAFTLARPNTRYTVAGATLNSSPRSEIEHSPVRADQFLLLAVRPLQLPASQFALGPGDAMPSRVRTRSRSTSKSAKVAKMLKNILPIGSVGS